MAKLYERKSVRDKRDKLHCHKKLITKHARINAENDSLYTLWVLKYLCNQANIQTIQEFISALVCVLENIHGMATITLLLKCFVTQSNT